MAQWFQLNTGGNPTIPSNYAPVTGSPSCSGSGKICAVNANPDGNGDPDLTDALKDEMILSLHTGIAQPNVRLRGTA
ncbi:MULTISPECIES: hypothetical protein [Sphingobacterium]|uniref:Uncharacterized protein n=2 Tax=Sphingobacterium TaxID=28453 RepID=A0A4R6WDW2_9SPHI|nr:MULTISPECIES: hypothetical protein [Sphingobacterium]TDQ77969.1 hypothetical protein CLV99_1944 [Sphingobacterium yanglingense]